MEQNPGGLSSSLQPRSAGRWLSATRFICSLALPWCWAIWWGGLTFYAAAVVPSGTEQFGSFGQGLVTQQVTRYLNVLALVVAALALLKGAVDRRPMLCIASVLLAGTTSALMYQHTLLGARMEVAGEAVSDDFYKTHATYLWLTTLQWCIGLFMGSRQPVSQ